MASLVTEEQLKALSDAMAVALKAGITLAGNNALPTPTAAGQVLVSKEIDGQIVATWDDATNLGLPSDSTPVANQLVFSQLTNCTYANDTLTYTGGVIKDFGLGYQAITDKPIDFTYVVSNVNYGGYLFVGPSNTFDFYANSGTSKGLIVNMSGGWGSIDGVSLQTTGFSVSKGDTVEVTIANNSVTLTNKTTGQSWISPQSDYLASPNYMGITINDIYPFTIKAL